MSKVEMHIYLLDRKYKETRTQQNLQTSRNSHFHNVH